MGYNEIVPRLFQGSAVSAAETYEHFDAIVLCAEEYQPRLPYFRGQVIRAPFGDSAHPTDKEINVARQAANTVVSAYGRGARVLVTCQAGLNRSGLVVGLAMRQLYPAASGPAVVAWIQRRRQEALCNPVFARIVATAPSVGVAE